MKPRRYVKKPVQVEAMGPLSYDNAASIAHWCGGSVTRTLEFVRVPTLHGMTIADLGDWVIQGPSGDFWPCKPDIFDETYAEVGGHAEAADYAALARRNR